LLKSKISNVNNLREKGFILVQGSVPSPWLYWFWACVRHDSGSMWKAVHLMVDKKRVKMGPVIRCNLQRHASCDLLPSARPYLLKFPPPSKIAPPAGDQAFNTLAYGDSSYSYH
jgi:hypothetical protein